MREMLKSVVDSGTARAANLATFEVAGKSGTARRNEPGKGYAAGRYNATFAGMFPASDPQYVIVARLIDPQGSYFGGTVSGGMVNGIIQAALATRDASLDRKKLAQVAKPVAPPTEKPLTPAQRVAALRDSVRQDSLRAPTPPKAEPQSTAAQVVVALPLAPLRTDPSPPAELRAVPAVYGLDTRQAVRALNAAGFQVSVTTGRDLRTRPVAGVLLRVGSTVQLERPTP
jgi:cell division protein FtsI (penicillin-binding protein 3)